MKIVFDLDNTIADELGSTVRPGMEELLLSLSKDRNHRLILWTNSPRSRAVTILREHGLHHLFSQMIFREDYDPENRGNPKDLRKIGADFLVDDDPDEIRFNQRNGKDGFLISPFRKNGSPDLEELSKLQQALKRRGFFRGLFRGFS